MTSFLRWWRRLESRERRLVSAAGCVVVGALVYLAAWEPAADGIRRLRTDLPALHEENAAMLAMATDVAGLRTTAAAAPPLAVTERTAAVRRSLERAGLSRAAAGPMPIDSPARAVSTLTTGGAVTTVTPAVSRAAPPDIAADGERVRVRFDDVDYGVWAGWLAAAETELAARAARVSVTSTAPKGPVGHVRAEAWLDWTPAGAPSFVRP